MKNIEFFKFREPRLIGINWLGLITLYKKEVLRFLNVWAQTIVSPIVTLILFTSVFTIAIGDGRGKVLGHDFVIFLIPGLISMQILQNAFANTSSSLMIAKIQGNIVDILFPPLSAFEVTTAMLLGGITRGLVVGVFSVIIIIPFMHVPIHNVFVIFLFAILGSSMLAAIGFATGLWSQKFDHLATITNFVVVPLSFLSGTFYSIEKINDHFHLFSQLNPFFYAIDGFRYGFLGQADGSIQVGIIYLLILNIALWFMCYILFEKGYRIKS